MNSLWIIVFYVFFIFILSETFLRFFNVPQPRIIPEPNGLLREEE